MNEKRKNRMGNYVDCGKEIYCGNIRRDIFYQEYAMLHNLKMLVDIMNGKEI